MNIQKNEIYKKITCKILSKNVYFSYTISKINILYVIYRIKYKKNSSRKNCP